MKQLPITNYQKVWLLGFLIAAIILTTLAWTQPSLAHPPQQEGDQPNFTGAVQTSPDGSAAIASQEAQLDAAYFAANGQLEELQVTLGGLALAEGVVEGSYTSPAILSPLGYTTDIVPLWGADLPESTGLRLETRLSTDGGNSWSDWVENPEAFYPVRDNLYSGNLIWVDAAQAALQFKVTLRSDIQGLSPAFRSLTLAFSDTSQGPTDGQIAGQMAGLAAADTTVCPVPKPGVISRTQWGCPDGQNSPRRPPQYAPVTHIIIHQTETPNQPQPYSGYAGWVRSVWNFHANVLRWGDVGYNYLIDPDGKIYEGRAGGDDVIGIHDTHNRGSMAIGFIGCYGNCDDRRLSVAQPSEAMLNSAIQLMAWKTSQKNLNPLGSGNYDGLSNIPTIAGGRDVVDTTSPGDNIYNRLGELRNRVKDRVNCPQACQITGVIFNKPDYGVNEPISYTVRLADAQGQPLPGATVTLDTVAGPVAIIQATAAFTFVDRTGDYEGGRAGLAVPGVYTFTFSAKDPTGTRFLPCNKTALLTVKGVITPTATSTPTATPTATPTGTSTPPTSTPTPTNTPTPTPTATTPAGPAIRVNPASLTLPVCSGPGSTSVEALNLNSLIAAQLQLRYNPAVAQVVDADPGRDGVQIRVGSAFAGNSFVAQNTVATSTGVISFAAVLLSGSPISGTANLINIDWQPVAVGNANLTLENVILVNGAGQPITLAVQNGQLQVTNCSGVTGKLALQGRSNHSGITVASSSGQQAQTGADGSFTIASADQLTFSHPGYLSAQTDVRAQLAQSSVAPDQPFTLAAVTLLAGDANADSRIDILDLAYIAKYYNSTDSLADLNGDGVVNILDLVLAAGNYGQRGPLTN
ncbi:MAG: N-acetylmuramoyl-L-alanine amidase [Anaerolineae bacterium]